MLASVSAPRPKPIVWRIPLSFRACGPTFYCESTGTDWTVETALAYLFRVDTRSDKCRSKF